MRQLQMNGKTGVLPRQASVSLFMRQLKIMHEITGNDLTFLTDAIGAS